jgi:hypothetical protein
MLFLLFLNRVWLYPFTLRNLKMEKKGKRLACILDTTMLRTYVGTIARRDNVAPMARSLREPFCLQVAQIYKLCSFVNVIHLSWRETLKKGKYIPIKGSCRNKTNSELTKSFIHSKFSTLTFRILKHASLSVALAALASNKGKKFSCVGRVGWELDEGFCKYELWTE